MAINCLLTCTRNLPDIDKPFSRWLGRNGGSYVFSVYKAESVPVYPQAVYVVVGNNGSQARPLLIGATNTLPSLFFLGGRFRAALKRGGNEVHVHVPAPGLCAKTVARDLAARLRCR